MFKSKLIILTFLLLVVLVSDINAQLVINEVMSSNGDVISDEDGGYEDWIELYNNTGHDIQLDNYSISDDKGNKRKWVFPSYVLKKDSFLLLFASGKNRKSGLYLHTNFSIKASGEAIYLYDATQKLLDYIPSTEIARNTSYGRQEDGGRNFVYFQTTTPGFSNLQGESYTPLLSLTSNFASGFYENEFELKFLNSLPAGSEIRYTLDGSNPHTESFIYDQKIDISTSIIQETSLSHITTTSNYVPHWLEWLPATEDIFKGIVIKAQVYNNGTALSNVKHLHFFLSPASRKRYSLPVVSISFEPDDLFGYDSGIYIPGKLAIEDDSNLNKANYHMRGNDWERKAHFCYIDTNAVIGIDQEVGIRIHGSGSRSLPIKSLRIIAKAAYGNNALNYPFFGITHGQSFKRLLLRSSGQDFDKTYMADALSQQIIQELDIETQQYQPVIVFLNGEYWGIHNLRERIDKDFLVNKKNIDSENIDLIAYNNGIEVVEGDYTFYDQNIRGYLDHYANELNNPRIFEHIATVIDLPNYIDYTISKIFFGSYDWWGNNVMLWREKKPDSKFRWISYDNDDLLRVDSLNSLRLSMQEGLNQWPNPDFSTHLFRHLIQNNTFKDSFLNRFVYHLKHTFKNEWTTLMLEQTAEGIANEMEEHIQRWNYPSSIHIWNNNLDDMRKKFYFRKCFIKNMLQEFFNIEDYDLLNEICTDTIPMIDEDFPIWIYPNPNNSGTFNIRFQQDGVYSNLKDIELIDSRGVVIWKILPEDIDLNYRYEYPLRLHLSKGIYVLRINGKKGNIQYQKVLVY